MAFQNLSKIPERVNCLIKLKGWDLLGLPLKAPLTKYEIIYTLPMLTILPTKVIFFYKKKNQMIFIGNGYCN